MILKSRRCVRLLTCGASILSNACGALPEVKCNLPEGAFYAFPNFGAYHGRKAGDKVIAGSLDLAGFLLEQAKVGVVPGAAFGADAHQRLSYATSMENIDKGLDRIAEALKTLK